MRFDTAVYFQTVTQGEYNAETGDYSPDTVTEVKEYADVTSAGIDTLKLIYGDIKQGGMVVRLQQPYTAPFDRLRIGSKLYTIDFSRQLRTKRVLVVKEVQ